MGIFKRALAVVGYVLFLGQIAAGAVIQGLADYPPTTPGNPFYYTTPGIQYALGSSTTFNPAGYDIRDLFGGTFDSYAPERGVVIFSDGNPIGTVSTVLVTLPQPIMLSGFNLCIAEDGGPNRGSGARSTREFKLFAGTTLIDDVQILDNSGTQTDIGVYGEAIVDISDTISNAPSSSTYTLEFVQNQTASGASGARIAEFTGFVPEPASLSLLALASLMFLGRRQSVK